MIQDATFLQNTERELDKTLSFNKEPAKFDQILTFLAISDQEVKSNHQNQADQDVGISNDGQTLSSPQKQISEKLADHGYDSLYMNFCQLPRRKRERFVYIKNWEDRRLAKQRIYQSIADYLNQNMMKKAKESLQYLGQLIKFFKGKVNLDQNSITIKDADITKCYVENNFFRNVNQQLQHINETQVLLLSKSVQFTQSLDLKINNQLIDCQRIHQIQFDEYQGQFTQQQQYLKKQQNLLLIKYNEYTQEFTDQSRLYMKTKDENIKVRDLLELEIQYLNIAQDHYIAFKKQSLQTVSYYQSIIIQETQYVEIIQLAFQKLMELQTTIYKVPEVLSFYGIQGQLELDCDSNFSNYQIEQLIPQDEIKYILAITDSQQVNPESLNKFFNNFDLKETKSKTMVITVSKQINDKEFQCLFRSKGEWRDAHLILSIDKSWLIYLTDQKTNLPYLFYSISIKTSLFTLSENQLEFQIQETKKTIIGLQNIIYLFKLECLQPNTLSVVELLES